MRGGGRVVQLTARSYPLLSLRMSRAFLLLSPYAFVACTGTSLLLLLLTINFEREMC